METIHVAGPDVTCGNKLSERGEQDSVRNVIESIIREVALARKRIATSGQSGNPPTHSDLLDVEKEESLITAGQAGIEAFRMFWQEEVEQAESDAKAASGDLAYFEASGRVSALHRPSDSMVPGERARLELLG